MSWHQATVAGYLLILVAGLVLAVLSHRDGSVVPRLALVFSRLTRTRPGRVAVLGAWLWLGLHYFAR